MIKNCKICSSKTINIYVNFPFFRHIDFKTINYHLSLRKCINCQIVYNNKKLNKISSLFKSKLYVLSNQTKHKMTNKYNNNLKTRTHFQANIIKNLIMKKSNLSILDVGCFDGQLLLDLNKINNKNFYYGYDINKRLKRIFPNKKNFTYLSNIHKNKNKRFDLIILSHSIMYINKIRDELLLYKKMLNENGILYIQMPNIEKNPFYALMGDQHNFFTSSSLMNFLKFCGYKSKVLKNETFKREIIMIAKKFNYEKKLKFKNNKAYESCLIKIKKTINNLKKINKKKLVVMGTTINGAFVEEILSDKVDHFVDENIIKRNFRGKKVLNPQKLNDNHQILLPYSKSNKGILNKFKSNYKGEFFLI